jgi:hypothetical protein
MLTYRTRMRAKKNRWDVRLRGLKLLVYEALRYASSV